MDEQTQVVDHLEDDDDATDTEEEGGDTSISAHPVAYLRVLPQTEIEQTDFPITTGETVLGRGSESNLIIPAKSLSRAHATILVEDGIHFIQDLGSRNKTFRGTIRLRPSAFYELTNECELMFANIKCVYYIGELPEKDGECNTEQTQSYEFDEKEADKEDTGEGDEEEEEEAGDGDNIEPTQAYHFGEVAEDEDDEHMDCDPTVAYNVSDLAEGDDDDKKSGGEDGDNESDADSTASEPLLGEIKQHKEEEKNEKEETGSEVKSKPERPKKSVCFAAESSTTPETGQTGSGDGGEDNDETDSESTQPPKDEEETKENKDDTETKETSVPELKRNATSMMDVDLPSDTGVLDPTVAYDMETDVESEHEEEKEDKKKEVVVKEKGQPELEPTVAYAIDDTKEAEREEDDSDKTDVEDNDSEGPSGTKDEDEAGPPEGGPHDSPPSEEATGESDEHDKVKPKVPAVVVSEQSKEDASSTKPVAGETYSKLLKVPECTKTLSSFSPMECMEQGGGTVLLESYEPTCEPSTTQPPLTLGRGTTVVLESYESTVDEEEERDSSEKGDEKVNDEASTETPSLSVTETKKETDVSGEAAGDLVRSTESGAHSKQKTIFAAASSRGGRGKGRRGRGRGRGRKTASGRNTASSSTTPPTTARETTEQLLKLDTPDVDSEDPLARTSTERLLKLTGTDGASKAALKGSSVVIPKLRLKAASSVLPMDVDVSDDTVPVSDTPSPSVGGNGESTKVRGGKSSRRGRGRGRGRGKITKPKATLSEAASETDSSIHDTVGVSDRTVETTCMSVRPSTADLLLDEESPDIGHRDDASASVSASANGGEGTVEEEQEKDREEEQSSSSVTSTPARGGRRGRKGRGGGASKRGGRVSTPKTASRRTPKTEVTSTPTLRHLRTTPSKTPSMSPSGSPVERPRVMFTGLIDKDGEKTVKELGGELVDSVYQCTHLITDKVRRTVKFLCCLSRGCVIVSDEWLEQCAQAKRFLPAEPFLVRDRNAERQHKFSLSKSHETAKHLQVLSGYKVHLTPSVKPEPDLMSDIIKCSGGEALKFSSPVSPGERVIIVTCEKDLSMCKESMDAGVSAHSTEFILGGVLRQELDLHSHMMTLPSPSSSSTTSAGRKRKAKEPSLIPSSKRRKR